MDNPTSSSNIAISRDSNRKSSEGPASLRTRGRGQCDRKIDDKTIITTIVKEETFHGDKPKTVIRYKQHARVFENGKSMSNVLNKLKVVKEVNSNHYPSKILTIPSDKSLIDQSQMSQLNSLSEVPQKRNKFKTRKKANVQSRKFPYVCIFVALISILVIFLGMSLMTDPIRMKELQYDLSKNVLSQHSAVRTFLDSIELLNQPSSHIIITCLIGSSGVGKTHFINILKKHIDSRTIHVFQPQDLTSFDLSYMQYRMIISAYNILVFDDLRKGDLFQLTSSIKKIMQLKGSNILIIAIFNIQDVDSHLKFSVNHGYALDIKHRLEKLSEFFFICKFEELNLTIVEDWLRNMLIDNNIDHIHHSNIIANLLKIQDVKNYGLKGLHGKLLLELNKGSFQLI